MSEDSTFEVEMAEAGDFGERVRVSWRPGNLVEMNRADGRTSLDMTPAQATDLIDKLRETVNRRVEAGWG